MKRRKAQDTVRGTWALRARGRAKKTNETDRERIKQETDYGAERLLGRERD